MAKEEITHDRLLDWDSGFALLPPPAAIRTMFDHALGYSVKSRSWYWSRIRNKRIASTAARFLAIVLVGLGLALPLISAIWSDVQDRLWCSQLALAAILVAGMVQLTDRVIGWSSGWLRYIATVFAIEDLTRQFELDWAIFVFGRLETLTADDAKQLFEVAVRFEKAVAAQVKDETSTWIAEFNTGMAALNEVLRSARESQERRATDQRHAEESLAAAGGSNGRPKIDGTPVPDVAVRLGLVPPDASAADDPPPEPDASTRPA